MVSQVKRQRPGIAFVTTNPSPKWEAVVEEQAPGGGEEGGGGGALTLSADGVLLYSGAAPILNENGTLIYTPIPVLTEAGTFKIE
jgi:hypothetical protein